MTQRCNLKVYISTNSNIHNHHYTASVKTAQAIFNGMSTFFNISIKVFNPSCNEKLNQDYVMLYDALKDSDCTSFTIVCKDTSVSTTTATALLASLELIVKDYIHDAEQRSRKRFDILWLAKWLDQCEKQYNRRHNNGRGMYVTNTIGPHGVQCLMFSPQGRDLFLDLEPITKDISLSNYLNRNCQDKIKAITFQPCPIKFDITYADKPIDYVKLCECTDLPNSIKPDKPGTDVNFFVFIIIGLVIVMIIYLLIKFGVFVSDRYKPQSFVSVVR